MSIELNTKDGHVTITNEVIATIAGGAAVECYGIVGMASKSQIRDGIAEILRKENYSRGIVVRQEDNSLHIDMYIIVSYGTKISEVAHNVQSQVKYTLSKTLGLEIDSVNIYIQGVRVAKD
ncbi:MULTISPECIES: Asp23/Gls24 family envelope stress response protein [Ornithinibacillus]|uniref:Asp23/Gls24 family envelope stress response protein n=2 Tax=Ornithinibacillus TaxID=484508 RepID=A0A923L3Q0_9BACI|nr:MULTISPECIES: Asp23/Gls24 family envelope stress response protein [Ornithinibacillus]MBC5635919.1 Asp23/Gls24 family envelope stress response protein [Ornithinibacillus hominis]MBS3680092.1 Asp23/Gls24 family envelope stress response protein [Ornithinibacillus massiliensis]